MTRNNGNNAEESKQDKYIDDPDFLRSLVQTFLQEYLEAEIADHLGAGKHERVSSRSGHRNGYKPRRLNTRVGKLFLDIPQDRESTFRTELFERYQRSPEGSNSFTAGDGHSRRIYEEGSEDNEGVMRHYILEVVRIRLV